MTKRPSRPAKTHRPDSGSAHPPVAHEEKTPGKNVGPVPSNPPGPQRRSTYFAAVAIYERGVEALQRHHYQKAAGLLESVLRLYPEEKELHERVRLYLSICERQAAQQKTAPETVSERLYAATLAINSGQYDQALAHLRLVRDEDPDNDHALYMLAVAHAQRLEHAEALAHLERAIVLNPENRGRARTDPDMEPIRGSEAFRAALDARPDPRADEHASPRRPPKARTGR